MEKDSGLVSFSEDFTEEELSRHINEKEALALFRFLFHLVNFNPLLLRGKKILIHIDNQVLCFIYNNGGSSKQPYITAICKNLFWLQAHNKFHLEVEWIPTEQNLADAMTREDKINDIILTTHVFKSLWEKYGAFEMDLMASSANVQLKTCKALDIFLLLLWDKTYFLMILERALSHMKTFL